MSLNSVPQSPINNQTVQKPPRGFAAMTPERRREIAAKGGSKVPAHKRAFSTDRELASKCGMRGGRAVAAENRTFSRDKDLAKRAGQKGGKKSKKNKDVNNEQVDRSVKV